MEHLEDRAHVVTTLDRVAQRTVGLDAIGVASAFTQPVQIAGIYQVADDPLRRSFGYTDPLGDVA